MSELVVVRACTRGGGGGSPTAVVLLGAGEPWPSDDACVARAAEVDASHTAFVRPDAVPIAVRFFTRAGELRACGHGTVAVHAVLGDAGYVPGAGPVGLAIGGREVVVRGAVAADELEREAWVAYGAVPVEPAPPDMAVAVAARLTGHGGAAAVLAEEAVVASPGAPRLLVEVRDRAALAALRPDLAALGSACRRWGLLGCLAHTVTAAGPAPAGSGRGGLTHVGAARMFAPAIGVDEDVANVNSTAGLVAVLAGRAGLPTRAGGLGRVDLALATGDSLGAPSTVVARAITTRHGVRVEAGGSVRLPPSP
jgi:PhzF family phenazine biosynthesis protein